MRKAEEPGVERLKALYCLVIAYDYRVRNGL
jgi:hypothetical protein